jgi:hypothetical protein
VAASLISSALVVGRDITNNNKCRDLRRRNPRPRHRPLVRYRRRLRWICPSVRVSHVNTSAKSEPTTVSGETAEFWQGPFPQS